MIEQILKDTDSKMQKAVSALTHELATIRTGRATPALVEHIKVDYHGVLTPLNQIGSISGRSVTLFLTRQALTNSVAITIRKVARPTSPISPAIRR